MSIKITPSDARKLLALADGEEIIVKGAAWLRLDSEIKVSPAWRSGDYDRDCAFLDRGDLRALVAGRDGLTAIEVVS
jgi:hypothetical protein